jgi:hypothetical protein
MPPLVALPQAGFNRVKFLDTGYLKAINLFYPASSIRYLPILTETFVFKNFVFFGTGFQGMILGLHKLFPGILSIKAL